MKNKIGVFDNYKKQKEIDEQKQSVDFLSQSRDSDLARLHQEAEDLAGHELFILDNLRKKWNEARKNFRNFSYDKELMSQSAPWTSEQLMDLGREGNSYVEKAKEAKSLYLKKLQEHLALLKGADKFKK
ncbi:MAG TPA: hypothetical protein PLB38_01795 [bacterium]|nr:hypothetical protein [bacterium]